MTSRFVVGIDLGTTNSALAYVDTVAGAGATVTPFPIPQVVGPGAVEERPLLPSFLYLPGAGEQPGGSSGRPREQPASSGIWRPFPYRNDLTQRAAPSAKASAISRCSSATVKGLGRSRTPGSRDPLWTMAFRV